MPANLMPARTTSGPRAHEPQAGLFRLMEDNPRKLCTFIRPLAFEYLGKAVNYNVEKAANGQPQNCCQGYPELLRLQHRAVLDDRAQFEDRQIHRHNNSTHQRAQDHDDDGLHQAGYTGNHVVNFRLVEVGGLAQHVVDGAGFFAD